LLIVLENWFRGTKAKEPKITVHEVGREQGVLPISVFFSTVHEVGKEQEVSYYPKVTVTVCPIPGPYSLTYNAI
jgi:hypothetical protein